MPNIELGKRIKERREHIGLSQDQLALKMGYKDKSAISKIESGQRDLTQKKIEKFANVLLTTVSYLMGWVDDPRDYAEILDIYGILSYVVKRCHLLTFSVIQNHTKQRNFNFFSQNFSQ